MKKKVTFSDIAKYTNFSKTTISRYFNNPESLTEETKNKIKNALTVLDYKQNKVAKCLANGKTEIIGVIVPNLFLDYYSKILNDIINTYPKNKYKFLVFLGHQDPEKEMNYIEELMAYQVEGLIILTHSISSEKLKDLDIPIVGIEREDKYISSVNSNNYSGSYEAINLLIENKCDELFHINNLPNKKIAAYDRIKAFENVCNENDKEPHYYFRDFNESYDDVYKEMINIYEDIESNFPNCKKGVFLSNDIYANIFLNILVLHGKKISEEYEIIGFDNSPISSQSIIPITTVGQDLDLIVNAAMDILINHINCKKEKIPYDIEHVNIETKLIKRKTTL